MKFFIVLFVLAVVSASAFADTKAVNAESIEPAKEATAVAENNAATMRNKRGFVVSAYTAPVAYTAAYTAPVAYTSAYSYPYAYSAYPYYAAAYTAPYYVA